jgi:hypothetical protein
MTTRKTIEATAMSGEILRLTTTMIVHEMRFPTTGNRPAKNVMATSVFMKGM